MIRLIIKILIYYNCIFLGKQVIRDVVKDEIILEVNRFNANMVMNHDEDGDGSCEETSQRKNSSKNSKSESSISLCTSNEQVCNITYIISHTSYNNVLKKWTKCFSSFQRFNFIYVFQ